MRRALMLLSCCGIVAAPALAAQARPGIATTTRPAARGALFDRVVGVLASSYHDSAFRTARLPGLADSLRPMAAAARSLAEERAAVHALLSRIPSSHLAILSSNTRRLLENELFGRLAPTLGLQLMRLPGAYYAAMVLEGGPAARAGIRPWDRIAAVDGVVPERSPRLDWRSDDAYLSDDRDPPLHALLVRDGEQVTLSVEARPGGTRPVTLAAEPWSALAAARAGARLVEHGGKQVAYIHLWYLHMTGVPELLRELMQGPLRAMDALVLDLRGRGGNAPVVPAILRLLEPGPDQIFDGPVVALVDRQSRSGKEVLAWELKRRGLATVVGEATAGAVIPATFADVGDESVLMFPAVVIPEYTGRLELRPTPPDLAVAWGGPLSGDRDPILEAGLDEAVRRAAAAPRPARVPAGQDVANQATPRDIPVHPDALPPLDTVLGRMVRGLGGETALRRHRGLDVSGTARLVDTPISGTFTIRADAPQGFESAVTLTGAGTLRQGMDAGRPWASGPGGQRAPLAGSPAAAIRLQSAFFGPLQYREVFPTIAVEGLSALSGHTCFRLRLTDAASAAITLYVDTAEALPRAFEFRAASNVGELSIRQLFYDYRTVDGVPVAHRIVVDAGGIQRQELQVEVVTWR